EYLKLEIELNAVQDARDLMSCDARRAYPPKPDCIGSGWANVIRFTPDVELCAATMDMKSGRQSAAERKAEVEAWMRKCKDTSSSGCPSWNRPSKPPGTDNGLPSLALLQPRRQ